MISTCIVILVLKITGEASQVPESQDTSPDGIAYTTWWDAHISSTGLNKKITNRRLFHAPWMPAGTRTEALIHQRGETAFALTFV